MSAAPEVIERFARALMPPVVDRVPYVDADNKRDEWAPLADAARSGRAFMVNIRDGLIVFDIEPDEEPYPETWAPAARRALEQIGCTVLRVASGSPGSEHWWFAAPAGWSTAGIYEVAVGAGAPKRQLRWGEKACRPPLSPHRSGFPVSLIEPTDVDEALDRLRRPNLTEYDHERWGYVLTHGDTPDGAYGGRRHRVVMAVAVAMMNAGLTAENFKAAVRGSPALGPKVTEKGGERWLDTTWANAGQRVRDSPAKSGEGWKRQLAAVRQTAATHPWGGRRDADRRVYTYLAEFGTQHGWPEFAQSQRTIANAIGATLSVVNATLKRLVRDGFLTVVKPGGAGQATTYRLQAKVAVGRTSSYLCSPLKEASTCSPNGKFEQRPDLWRALLPPASWDTWQTMLPDTWMTVEEVKAARPGGLSAGTIRIHLRALHSAALIDRNGPQGQRWLLRPYTREELDLLAVDFGVAGATERQQQRFEYDREQYSKWHRQPRKAA